MTNTPKAYYDDVAFVNSKALPVGAQVLLPFHDSLNQASQNFTGPVFAVVIRRCGFAAHRPAKVKKVA